MIFEKNEPWKQNALKLTQTHKTSVTKNETMNHKIEMYSMEMNRKMNKLTNDKWILLSNQFSY